MTTQYGWRVKTFGPYGSSQNIQDWLNLIQQTEDIIIVELHSIGTHGEILATVKTNIVTLEMGQDKQ